MARQRETKNLGLNRSRDREKIFRYIEEVLGIKKKFCSRGRSKDQQKVGFRHVGENPLPIRNFNLLKVHLDETGNVIMDSRDGLQANCMACERKFRLARIKRNKKKYEKMTDGEIYNNYKKEYDKISKKCSMCKLEKDPSEFPISRGMETGLHNTCRACSKSYSESVGGRWIIYSIDGHEVMRITDKDSCAVCSSKENLHKDHIFPVSKGGTDNNENLQVLCRKHNLSKSNTLISPIIKSVIDIKDKMVCERYLPILQRARKKGWSLVKFESEITRAVRNFILWKSKLSDKELIKFFEEEKARNNRKHSVSRAVSKFRKYCGTVILEIDKYILEKDKN